MTFAAAVSHRLQITMSTVPPPTDISEILRHIPHRYPFILIDRMRSCEPHRHVHVIKNVTSGEWFFGSAKSGVMPQMLIVEALAQAAGVLCHYSDLMSDGRQLIFFAGVENILCNRDVRAGDTLDLKCKLRRAMRGVVKLEGAASVRGEIVLKGDITAVIRPHPSPA